MPDVLERRVRALTPHIGAFVELPWGEPLGVLRAGIAGEEGPEPGALEARDGRLLYGATGGALELLEVHPAASARWTPARGCGADAGRLG